MAYSVKDKALSKSAREKLRSQVSAGTIKAAIEVLKKYGLCMVVRPTGFGKSYMLARLTNGVADTEKSLYVYPTNIIKTSVIHNYGPNSTGSVKMKNVEFISYSALNNKYKDGTVREYLKQFRLVMLDECHMAGASGFMAIYEEVKDLFEKDKQWMIGVTATPNRTNKTKLPDGSEEMVNVLKDIFDNNTIYTFTLKDCFKSGLMLRPRYVEIVYNTDELKASVKKRLAKSERRLEEASSGSEYIQEDNNKLLRELSKMIDNIANAPTQIKKVITDERGRNPNYLKFITFCRNKRDIEERQSNITSWFQEAYPNYTIREHIIVSKSNGGEESFSYEDEIVKAETLDTIEESDETIDLIYCVDMLNMGYHIDNIDGILMMRSTESQIVYLQQIGRCLSVTASKRAIILDFVKNVEMGFFKEENKKMAREEARNTGMDEEESEKMLLDKADMYISDLEDGTGKLLSQIEESMKAIENPAERGIDSAAWWYTVMKAPLFVILRIMNKPVTQINITNLVKDLKSRGIQLENEVDALKILGANELRSIKGAKTYLEFVANALEEVR